MARKSDRNEAEDKHHGRVARKGNDIRGLQRLDIRTLRIDYSVSAHYGTTGGEG